MTKFEITVHQFIKATQTLTFNITCDAKDLENIKQELLEDLYNNEYSDNDNIELVNTLFDDVESDKFASFPTIIETTILK